MSESDGSSKRDDLPRVSVDSFQDLMRIKENVNAAAIATLESRLAQQGLAGQLHLFLPHMEQVFLLVHYIEYMKLTPSYLIVCGENFSNCKAKSTHKWPEF